MKNIEGLFEQQRKISQEMTAPGELEQRLRKALIGAHNKRRSNKWIAAASIIAVLLITIVGYNFDTLAYYGKKITGYDSVMSTSLQKLNAMGKGQEIGKSYKFANGVRVTLDGVMLDDNGLIAFYRLSSNKMNTEKLVALSVSVSIKGNFGDIIMNSSKGMIDKTKNQICYKGEFKTQIPLKNNVRMIFSMSDNNVNEQGEVSFTIDKNKAMGHTLKKALNLKVRLGKNKIRINSILASSMTTSIKGSVRNIFELGFDEIFGERARPMGLTIKLTANGKEISSQGGEIRTDMSGTNFEYNYEPLPSDTKSLQIKEIEFNADYDINQSMNIKIGDKKHQIELMKQVVSIDRVYADRGNTYVTISSSKDVILTRVKLKADGKIINLNKTIGTVLTKDGSGRVLKTRTLEFKGEGSKLQLLIKRMMYTTTSNKTIDIPID